MSSFITAEYLCINLFSRTYYQLSYLMLYNLNNKKQKTVFNVDERKYKRTIYFLNNNFK